MKKYLSSISSKKHVYVVAGLALAGVVSASVYAHAGTQSGSSVNIAALFGSVTASGTIGTVHNSGNATEFIGCHAAVDTSATQPNDFAVACTARDSAGGTFDCTKYGDQRLFDAVNGINPDSHIEVEAASRNGGTCRKITVWHYSTHYMK